MKQEILLHFIAKTRFQSIEVFCGDVEFDAVSAELDFVNAFMETVSNDFVYDEIFIIVSKSVAGKLFDRNSKSQ